MTFKTAAELAVKNKISKLFIKQKIVFNFVYFSCAQTLFLMIWVYFQAYKNLFLQETEVSVLEKK